MADCILVGAGGGNVGMAVKTISWTGNGQDINVIQFPVSDTPTVILGITGTGLENGVVVVMSVSPFIFGIDAQVPFLWARTTAYGEGNIDAKFDTAHNTLTLSPYNGSPGTGAGSANINGVPYVLMYI